jgi:hypothetical protein
MKVTFVVAALIGLIGRCSELPVDLPWHGHGHGHGHPPPPAADDDAGVEDDSCMQLGLYVDHHCKHLARGVVPYSPSYELWADGADKERFIFLPDGKKIDTTNAERWTFPVGTRVYKTFTQNGLKLETRVFRKIAEPAGIESWTYEAYAWREDQRSVDLVGEQGQPNVLGTDHDIPKKEDCARCHTRAGADILNGFEAIQLNHAGPGWTLQRLIEQGRLVNGTSGAALNVSTENARVPGTPVEQAALGYLHANCGNCHGGPTPPPKARPLDLSLEVGKTNVTDAAAYKAAIACTDLRSWTGHDPYVFVIDPGSAATSGIIGRMSARATTGPYDQAEPVFSPDQMPRLGTEKPDLVGIARVSRWIDRLDTQCVPAMP